MTQFPAVDYAFSIKSTAHDIYEKKHKIFKNWSLSSHTFTLPEKKWTSS